MTAVVGGNPINFIDPFGLCRVEPTLGPGFGSLSSDYPHFQPDISLDDTQLALDGAGLTPVIGVFADALNTGISLFRGNFLDAGLNVLAAVPILGQLTKGGQLTGKAGKLLNTSRQSLLNTVSDAKLKNRLNQMYRKDAKVGSGSTADAIRHELKTGELLSPKGHFLKGQEMRTGLLKDLKSGRLNANDAKIAKDTLIDLQNALSGN